MATDFEIRVPSKFGLNMYNIGLNSEGVTWTINSRYLDAIIFVLQVFT